MMASTSVFISTPLLMNKALFSILILNLGVNDKYIDFKHLYNV